VCSIAAEPAREWQNGGRHGGRLYAAALRRRIYGVGLRTAQVYIQETGRNMG